jgi:GNAT superfamily N-acetyltransferase
VNVYAEVYADKLGDPFFTVDRFLERFRGHTSREGYALVTCHVDAELVGYAYGLPLAADTAWWRGLRSTAPDDVRRETGRRTFALNEIMVRAPWRRHGIARGLHDALLGARAEERATLLVDPANTPARTAYLRWGWEVLGTVQPFPDAPVYDAMTIDLPLGRPD